MVDIPNVRMVEYPNRSNGRYSECSNLFFFVTIYIYGKVRIKRTGSSIVVPGFLEKIKFFEFFDFLDRAPVLEVSDMALLIPEVWLQKIDFSKI